MKCLFDLNYAFRLLLKKPLFTVTTIAIMAIGLGLSVYTYSLLNTLLYMPLDIKGDESLVAITGRFDRNFMRVQSLDAYVAQQVREQTDSFSEFVVYYRRGGTALISGRNSDFAARKFNSSFTEWGLFDIVGVAPLMGRALQKEDHHDGAEPVIVLGYAAWQSYFSADPNIVGRMILVDATPTRVIGVMPEGFLFPSHAQAWQPMRATVINPPGFWQVGFVNVMARLKPGITIKQANADVGRVIQSLKAEYPDFESDINGFVKPYKQEGLEKQAPLLISMAVIVLLILLLSCLNIGNLLLARVNERFKEIAIRVALGVPQYRLLMQMLWESLIICSIGGGIAVLFAAWGLELTEALIDTAYSIRQNKPYWWQLGIGVDTLIALSIVIVFTISITSIIPVLRTIRGDFNAVLRDGTRGALTKRSAYFSNILVIGEILLSCVVLVIAAMVMTMTIKASNKDYGANTENVIVGTMELPMRTYPRHDLEKRLQFYQQLRYEMEKELNIKNFLSMSTIPGSGSGWNYLEVDGREYPTLASRPKAYSVAVLNGSIKGFGVALLEGRYFESRDNNQQELRAILSRSMAHKLFANESPIGKKVRFVQRNGNLDTRPWLTVIGVVEDVTYGSVIDSTDIAEVVYHSNNQMGIGSRFFVSIRYSGTEKLTRQSINAALKRVDPDVPIYDLHSYESLLKAPLFLVSNMSKLFVICGLMAILLAASGIYAVISNSVSMRMQEIGLRRALGASDNNIINLFLKRSTWQLVFGIGMGVLAAIGLTSVITDYMAIHGVAYIVAYLGIPVLIVSTVLLATYIPTKQAIVFEPSDALHYE